MDYLYPSAMWACNLFAFSRCIVHSMDSITARFNDGDLDALDAAAKASYVKSAFSIEPIMFGKWRD